MKPHELPLQGKPSRPPSSCRSSDACTSIQRAQTEGELLTTFTALGTLTQFLTDIDLTCSVALWRLHALSLCKHKCAKVMSTIQYNSRGFRTSQKVFTQGCSVLALHHCAQCAIGACGIPYSCVRVYLYVIHVCTSMWIPSLAAVCSAASWPVMASIAGAETQVFRRLDDWTSLTLCSLALADRKSAPAAPRGFTITANQLHDWKSTPRNLNRTGLGVEFWKVPPSTLLLASTHGLAPV